MDVVDKCLIDEMCFLIRKEFDPGTSIESAFLAGYLSAATPWGRSKHPCALIPILRQIPVLECGEPPYTLFHTWFHCRVKETRE